jgi:hypothetical protein
MKVQIRKKKPTTNPVPLPELPAPARGPADFKRFSETERDPNDPLESSVDLAPLDRVQGRLYKRTPFTKPVLGLEFLDGPYKGIVFTFTKFSLGERNEQGMFPTRYETEVLVIPNELKDRFEKDDVFDDYTTGIALAWLGYIHTHDLAPLIKMRANGVQ